MTALDPYPPNLATLEPDREEHDRHLLEMAQPAIVATPDAVNNRLIATLNRVAEALEQHTLALLHPAGPQAPALAALPPVQPVAANGACPIHGTPWKVVPAGISKKTGNAYEAFRACSTTGCDQRPPR